jgi:hypothetical protein
MGEEVNGKFFPITRHPLTSSLYWKLRIDSRTAFDQFFGGAHIAHDHRHVALELELPGHQGLHRVKLLGHDPFPGSRWTAEAEDRVALIRIIGLKGVAAFKHVHHYRTRCRASRAGTHHALVCRVPPAG